MNTRHLLSLAAAAFILLIPSALSAQSIYPAAPSLAPRGSPNGALELDRNGDGKVDYRVTYDSVGLVAHEEMDYDFDGVFDTFYYYVHGVLQRVEIDSKNSGKVDIWVYLVDGKYVQRYERDTNGDGKPDVVRSFDGG